MARLWSGFSVSLLQLESQHCHSIYNSNFVANALEYSLLLKYGLYVKVWRKENYILEGVETRKPEKDRNRA
jgi:hypothetical protein